MKTLLVFLLIASVSIISSIGCGTTIDQTTITKIETILQEVLSIAATAGAPIAQQYVTSHATEYNLNSSEVTAINNAIASVATVINNNSNTTTKNIIDWKSKETYELVHKKIIDNLKKSK